MNFDDYEIKLSYGSHDNPQQGMCVMECVAYIAGEEHTDAPKCADVHLSSLALAFLDAHLPTLEELEILPDAEKKLHELEEITTGKTAVPA